MLELLQVCGSIEAHLRQVVVLAILNRLLHPLEDSTKPKNVCLPNPLEDAVCDSNAAHSLKQSDGVVDSDIDIGVVVGSGSVSVLDCSSWT